MNKKREVYLDNAASTRMDDRVLEAMLPYMKGCYGNPSSTHRLGNEARVAISEVRREVMDRLGAEDGSVFFTSGGTEANNWAIMGGVEACGIKHIITSAIEHDSVLSSVRRAVKVGGIGYSYVPLGQGGEIDYEGLGDMLARHPKALVSLMHANNEVGNVTDLHRVGGMCRRYGAIFHTDMMQTIGHYPIRLKELPVDMCTASAHKFYGPKGVGFVYVRQGVRLMPLLYGGLQERGLRGGTEHIAGIVGLGKALAICTSYDDRHRAGIRALKGYMIERLREEIPSVVFHGLCTHPTKSLANLLNIGVCVEGVDSESLLFRLSIEGIYASKGSACMSGASSQSHVLEALKIPEERAVLRLSISKYTRREDVDYVVKRLSSILYP